MENPYARPAAGAAASAPTAAPATPEAQQLADYEAAIGPNRGYYLPKFEQFDANGPARTWHWPAFFVTTPWYLYRKMWLWGILNLAWPWVVALVLSIVFSIVRPSVTVGVIVALVVLAIPSFVLAAFANALYWKHLNKLIRALPASFATQPDKRRLRLERHGGTGVGPMIGVLAGGGFFMVSILAGIAIPAYQDYTIRSQITEGLNLAAPLKAEVVDLYLKNGAWPEQADLGAEPPSGRYTSSVSVESGSVVIVYGNQVNGMVAGKRLVLTPALDMAGDIRWICGDGKVEPGERMAEGPSGTDIPNKYLPSLCRTGARVSQGP